MEIKIHDVDKRVVHAWKTRKAMIIEAGRNYPWINGALIMDMASGKLQRYENERLMMEAEIFFLKAVIREYGPDTKIRIKFGVFTLITKD